MKKKFPKHCPAIWLAALLLLTEASGCGLIYEYPVACEEVVEVEFDWSGAEAPEFYMPDGMTTLYYPDDGSEYWRYELSCKGGRVELPNGGYNILAVNNDTRSVNQIYEETYYGATVYTQAQSVMEATFGEKRGAEPPHPDESQPLRSQADMMYVADYGDTLFNVNGGNLKIILYPRQFTPRYKVIVEDVENLESVSAASFAITGLSGGKYLAGGRRVDDVVTVPGSLAVSALSELCGDIVSFGPAKATNAHILAVYVWLRNGEKRVYRFDVTERIEENPDAMSLTIRVGGIKLPEVIGGENVGNINIGIDNWITEDVELSN